MGHEDRRSLRNSLKLPPGKRRPSLHPTYSSTLSRRQQGLKRFLQPLREGLRDQDRIRHSNGTTAIPAIGASNSPSQKFPGMLMSHTNSFSTTTMFRFRQRRSAHTMWVSPDPFLHDELTRGIYKVLLWTTVEAAELLYSPDDRPYSYCTYSTTPTSP